MKVPKMGSNRSKNAGNYVFSPIFENHVKTEITKNDIKLAWKRLEVAELTQKT